MFLHQTNILYCVTIDFSVENCECSKVPPGLGIFQQNTGVKNMGFVFKMSIHEEFTYYLKIRGNIKVYVAFCCNNLSLLVQLQNQYFKKMFKCAPLSPTLYYY